MEVKRVDHIDHVDHTERERLLWDSNTKFIVGLLPATGRAIYLETRVRGRPLAVIRKRLTMMINRDLIEVDDAEVMHATTQLLDIERDFALILRSDSGPPPACTAQRGHRRRKTV